MKAIIMAAGVGSRISRHLHELPKCCVEIAGAPLICQTVRTLHALAHVDITVITGYHSEKVEEVLAHEDVHLLRNPVFRVTNSMASLWWARHLLDGSDDVVVMNGDVYAEPAVYRNLFDDKRSPLLLADSSRISEADYRFQWDADSRLVKFGKDLSDSETSGEYVGMGILHAADVIAFREDVCRMVMEEKYGCWWEDALYQRIAQHGTIYVKDVSGLFWGEVDYVEDLERIRAFAKDI